MDQKMDLRDIKNICSVCLKNVDQNALRREPEVDAKDIWEKIAWCFQLTFNIEKNLPYSFCQQCLEELNLTCYFRTKCVKNQEWFQIYCNKLKVPTVSEANNDLELDNDIFSEHDGNCSRIGEEKDENPFICDICNKMLKTKKSLLKHIVSMHEKRDYQVKVTGFGSSRQYHCSACSYSTRHSQTLRNHLRIHNGERPFKCECGKSFTQTSSLAAHQKSHSSVTYFTCTECGKQFKHAFSLKTHMKVHSDGSFSCHICSKVLKSKRTLTSHLHRHYKIYNFNCEDCGDTFVTSAELHNHKSKHSSIKNIVCHVCDYATHSKKNLIAHLKRHEGDKAYKCIYCEKAFITEGNLRRHLRVHTREKPFICTLCLQKFVHSSSLNNHMLTFHGIKYKWGDDKFNGSKKKGMKSTE